MPTFSLTLAYSVRCYGTTEIEADTMAEAIEAVRAEAVRGSHGEIWDNVYDVDHCTAIEETIVSIEDNETNERLNDISLCHPAKPYQVLTAEELAHSLEQAGNCDTIQLEQH